MVKLPHSGFVKPGWGSLSFGIASLVPWALAATSPASFFLYVNHFGEYCTHEVKSECKIWGTRMKCLTLHLAISMQIK